MLIDTTDCPSSPVLVAVSGGSDSLALLKHLHHQLSDNQLYAATVDHGLRPEAVEEANFVSQFCKNLGRPHTTLKWTPNETPSSQSARVGRYELLVAHARNQGAATIALGHTLDDQAETLLMRAIRAKAESGTRGLSGMSEWSSYEDIKLWRPLLDYTRNDLQQSLQSNNQVWINDPSNENLNSERVRIRQFLNHKPEGFPSKEAIAHLAKYSAKTRLWLGNKTAIVIDKYCKSSENGEVSFQCPAHLPKPVVLDTLSTLILAVGGMPYRPAISKIQDTASALTTNNQMRCTVGRCIVDVKSSTANIKREDRNMPPLPLPGEETQIYDRRWLLPQKTDGQPHKTSPFITTLERFRPDVDDQVYFAVKNLLSKVVLHDLCST